ncbi:hypothetical protein L3X38_041713 [Prunus dulcis]|uniref:Uncharacterized protein n=1 Tax=Prunus dulcis TaxID=3755 RepID=A0AAD4UT79_PRUDU|nr:hypothetical protein L3X38_041713 [Prunus dulcis]
MHALSHSRWLLVLLLNLILVVQNTFHKVPAPDLIMVKMVPSFDLLLSLASSSHLDIMVLNFIQTSLVLTLLVSSNNGVHLLVLSLMLSQNVKSVVRGFTLLAANCFYCNTGDSDSSPVIQCQIYDTGATHHMTPNLSVLETATPYDQDDKTIVGNGEADLLSVYKLCRDNKYMVTFDDVGYCVQDKATRAVLLKGRSSKSLYHFPKSLPFTSVSSPTALLG